MKRTDIFSVIAGVAALAGCGEGGGSVAEFVDVCVEPGGMQRKMCECIGDLAGQELSPEGIAFLISSMGSEEGRAQAFNSQLDTKAAMKAGMFMVTAPTRCMSVAPEEPGATR